MKRQRLYDANHMKQGIGHVAALRQKAVDYMPQTLEARQPQQEEIEELEGHCLGCKGKSKFQVEGQEKTKNGALRKYGKCTADGCGTMMSLFTKGTAD